MKIIKRTQKDLANAGYEKLFNKKYGLAEKLLLMALDAEDDNPIDRHFVYNFLIDLYYKLREKREDALEKCVYYCKEDIKRLPEFLKIYKKEYGDLPQCPSIIQLAIIYEKNGKLQEAIGLCNLAIKSELKNGTKIGFQGRLERLDKKIKE